MLLILLLARATLSTAWVLADVTARVDGGVVHPLGPNANVDLLAASAIDEAGVGSRDILLFEYGSPFGVSLAYSAFPGDTLNDVGGACSFLCDVFNAVGQWGGGDGAGSIHFWEAEAAWCHASPTQTLLGGGPGTYHWCACLFNANPVPSSKAAGCTLVGTARGTQPGCVGVGDSSLGVWDSLALRWRTSNSSAVLSALRRGESPPTVGMLPLPSWVPGWLLPGECLCAPWATGSTCATDRRPYCTGTAGCAIRNLCARPEASCAACGTGWWGPTCALATCVESYAAWALAPGAGAPGARCGGRGVGHCGDSSDASVCECTAGGDPRSDCKQLVSPATRTACYSPVPVRSGPFFSIATVATADCSGHGFCYNLNVVCVCDAGWTGRYCATGVPDVYTCRTQSPRTGGCRYPLPPGNTNSSGACGSGIYLLPLLVRTAPATCRAARGRLAALVEVTAATHAALVPAAVYRSASGAQAFNGGGVPYRAYCVLPLCYVLTVDGAVPPGTAGAEFVG
jgi:EGF-like domain